MDLDAMQSLLLPLAHDLDRFLHRGGPVLWLLGVVSLVLWTGLAEHRLFLRRVLPRLRRASRAFGAATAADQPWREARRSALLSRASRRLQRGLPMLRTMVVLCPLLGLLGTVLGMIEVFETMALVGNADPKALSSGIARAVLSTMAGLVVALPAMYLVSRTQRRIAAIEHRLYLDSAPASSVSGASA